MSDAGAEDGKIICQIDNAKVHVIENHIKKYHSADWTIEKYKEQWPDAPLLSPFAQSELKRLRVEKERKKLADIVAEKAGPVEKKPFHEVFEMGNVKAAMNKAGNPIMIDVRADLDEESQIWVPEIDNNYVFDIDLTKTAIMALALNMPAYFWGYHGTGKTSSWEQVAARTNRPFMRVQHTINTEEAHILGQYIVKDGATQFQLGPLPLCMMNGWIYCADEYDFAMPSVVSVYQPVLEGKPLMIKEAPLEMRVIRPHPNFRFVATGNTNGTGDESGLYQGTQLQNAANYSRFTVVQEVQYMKPNVEAAIIARQSTIEMVDAEKLVSYANEVRTSFKGGNIGSTISPRELIGAARIGLIFGSDWRKGLEIGFANRLSRTDKEVVDQFAQRVFG